MRIENYSMEVWQGDLAAGIWDTGPLLHSLERDRPTVAAILQGERGIEVAVVQDARQDVYHVGMIAPKNMYLDETVTPPSSITLRPADASAARKVTALLDSYDQAVLQMQLNHLGDDLAWAHESFEPGTVTDPPRHDLADAFTRFVAVAPHIIAALRTNDTYTFNKHEKAFLERMDAAFGRPDPAQEDAGTTPQIPSVDPLALWLIDGEGLVELARDASRAAPAHTAASLVRAVAASRALPSPPVQARLALSRR
ncbi:hypothetical protein [Streptomyces sp. NPDC093225]|uniref:hypothetical protein n=1 Tax=Streptomyces sp. NPDC093225 TaxID=3366034 RepID=UPI003825F5EE